MAKGVGTKLSVGCQTFLKEWYANEPKEDIRSKYIDKGNFVEDDLIDFMAEQLGFGLAKKNIETIQDDYFEGTCDVELPSCIVDVKAMWSYITLLNVLCIDPDHEWQVRGYMHLYNKLEAIVFYGLVNTPEDINYGNEVTYDHIPAEQRWIAFKVKHDPNKIEQIKVQVLKCRAWLIEYDLLVKARMGKVYDN